MEMNVSQLLQDPIGAMRKYQVSETVHIPVDDNDHLVRGEIRLLRTQRSVLVKATLRTEVELTCGRCLSLFSSPTTVNFEEEYMPTVDVASGVPLSSSEEPGSFTIDDHHIIDLTEAIRQYALLAVPMKPLCRKDCAGLCQNCGHNLNEGPCGCPVQEIDPRWAELIGLL